MSGRKEKRASSGARKMTAAPVMPPVDLDNCDDEPIHLIGHIQSFGYLIAASEAGVILRASENISMLTESAAEELIGRHLTDIFQAQAAQSILELARNSRKSEFVEHIPNVDLLADGSRYDLVVHWSNDCYVFEFEQRFSPFVADTITQVRRMMAAVEQMETINEMCWEGVRQLRALTGYDRVMVYQFTENNSGIIVAEDAKEGIGSFLHHRFPATDIPKQARALYERNLIRMIADVASVPVPIYPHLDEKGLPLDLSMSSHRSVSPIHIEYLSNMKVGGSMSISIISDARLWGLFACHHYSAVVVPHDVRRAADLFGQLFAVLIEQRHRELEQRHWEKIQRVNQRILNRLEFGSTFSEKIGLMLGDVGQLIQCDGMALWIDGRLHKGGVTPSDREIMDFRKHLVETRRMDVIASSKLSDVYPQAERFVEKVAGAIVVPISTEPRDYLFLFRRAKTQVVAWGGNPNRPKEYDIEGARVSPRKSFETWRETVKNMSLEWTPLDRRAAQSLRATILEVVYRLTELVRAERESLASRQELIIGELNHRIRNILGLVKSVISSSRATSGDGDIIEQINGRIQALAAAHEFVIDDGRGPGQVRTLIEDKAKAYLGEDQRRVRIDGPDVSLEPGALTTMSLVIHELLTNASKYGALSPGSTGSIDVTCDVDEAGDLTMTWRETGGPKVTPPSRKGFGSTLIDRSVPHDLNGAAHIDYRPEGIFAEFKLPGEHVAGVGSMEVEDDTDEMLAGDVGDISLSGQALIVENNMIIALDTEMMLTNLGAESVKIVGSVEEYLKTCRDEAFTVAIVDYDLGDETSDPIISDLESRSIPLLIATGYAKDNAFPEQLARFHVLRKPFSLDHLRIALSKVI